MFIYMHVINCFMTPAQERMWKC